jgi:glycosyltransferase involved in cell wall biosynthesis
MQKVKKNKLYFDIQNIPEDFLFIFVGTWVGGNNIPIGEDRKNIGLLIKAFYEIFKNKKKRPALILKTNGASSSYMDRREILKRIDIIKKSVPGDNLPNIYLIHGELNDEEINSLYNHPKIKAMISLTKGEGFGRPLLEFSLTNKPIITTGWSGHTDFLKPEYSALMSGKLTPVHPSAVNDFLIKESQWFSVDHNSVGHFMTDVVENYKEWEIKGKRQGYYSRTNFNFEKMKEQLSGILDRYDEKMPKPVKFAELKLPKLKKI